MERREFVLGVVLRALSDLNDELDAGSKIEVSETTPLFGPDATLDSLSLVSVIVDVETALTTELGDPISLTDDRAMSREVSPFSDVTALTDYILELVAEMQPA